MASAHKQLMLEIEYLQKVFPITHDVFRILSAGVYDLICSFCDLKEKHTISCNITDMYPSVSPMWFSVSEDPHLLKLLEQMAYMKVKEPVLVNMTKILSSELYKLKNLPIPNEITNMKLPLQESSENLDPNSNYEDDKDVLASTTQLSVDSSYPPHWPKTCSAGKRVAVDDVTFKYLEEEFVKSIGGMTVSVKSIEEICNLEFHEKYEGKKRHLMKKHQNINERLLYHGTEYRWVASICAQNFDWRLSGEHFTAYGQGSYFARDASYSHTFSTPDGSRVRYMFVANVLVGRSTWGSPSMKRPPPISSLEHELYDSCVDSIDNPSIFVIFERDQCYPRYLISYTCEGGVQVPKLRRKRVSTSTNQMDRDHGRSSGSSHYNYARYPSDGRSSGMIHQRRGHGRGRRHRHYTINQQQSLTNISSPSPTSHVSPYSTPATASKNDTSSKTGYSASPSSRHGVSLELPLSSSISNYNSSMIQQGPTLPVSSNKRTQQPSLSNTSSSSSTSTLDHWPFRPEAKKRRDTQ